MGNNPRLRSRFKPRFESRLALGLFEVPITRKPRHSSGRTPTLDTLSSSVRCGPVADIWYWPGYPDVRPQWLLRGPILQRTATCCCGALSLTAIGDPIKISACHCKSCQKRTGSAFSVAVFFEEGNTRSEGVSEIFSRLGDSGLPVDFHFCPRCATTLFWYPKFRPGWIGVAIGCFNDHTLAPTQAVYEEERLGWAQIRLSSR